MSEAASVEKGHWSDWVALVTAVLAVITAFASAESSNLSSSEILLQNQEADRWALFQAESLKAHGYEMQNGIIDLLPPGDAELNAKREAVKKANVEAKAKYTQQKQDAEKQAKDLAAQRDRIDVQGDRYGRSVIGLQIAIVLCSVAGITRKGWLLGAGLLAALWGVIYFAAAAL